MNIERPRTMTVTRFLIDSDEEPQFVAGDPLDTFKEAWRETLALAKKYRETSGQRVVESIYTPDEGTIRMTIDPNAENSRNEAVVFRVLPISTTEEIIPEREDR